MNKGFCISMTGVTPEVTIDGQPLRGVRELRVMQRHGEFPQVVALFDADQVEVDGVGVVDLARIPGENDAATFLANVSPSDLEEWVMARSDFGTPVLQTALEVLREIARGTAS